MVKHMKKIIIALFLISSLYLINNKDEIIIPSNSIRFRIIANSNTIEDQIIKNKIKDELINGVFNNIKKENDIEKTIPLIKEKLDNYNIKYDLKYGNNYFPSKTYKGITYPSGNYKSLVITINQGLGNNYWCVLYPPLCLIDDDNTNNIEYKSLVKEIIDKHHLNTQF